MVLEKKLHICCRKYRKVLFVDLLAVFGSSTLDFGKVLLPRKDGIESLVGT